MQPHMIMSMRTYRVIEFFEARCITILARRTPRRLGGHAHGSGMASSANGANTDACARTHMHTHMTGINTPARLIRHGTVHTERYAWTYIDTAPGTA